MRNFIVKFVMLIMGLAGLLVFAGLFSRITRPMFFDSYVVWAPSEKGLVKKVLTYQEGRSVLANLVIEQQGKPDQAAYERKLGQYEKDWANASISRFFLGLVIGIIVLIVYSVIQRLRTPHPSPSEKGNA